jgi:hypothetical protein
VASTRHGRVKGRRALLVTLALAGGLLATAVSLRGYCPQVIAEHYRRQLETVPEAEAGELLAQAARLEAAGIPVLVEAMGSRRKAVAAAGHQTLLDELSRWQLLRARDSSPLLAILAESLAERADRFPPAARRDAAYLATQILLWPLDGSKADRGRVLACCEKVVRVCGGQVDGPALRDGEGADLAPEDFLAASDMGSDGLADHLDDDAPQRTGVPLPRVSALPGGGLADQSDPSLATAPACESDDSAPKTAVDGPALEQPLRLLAEPENAKSLIRPPRPLQADKRDNSLSLRPLGFGSSGAEEGAALPESSSDAAPLDLAGTLELMRQLFSPDSPAAGDARRKLAAAGFTPVHFEIARQMFDPDAAVRVALARRLPGLGSIDPVPWLECLSRDENAEVRLAAMAILATTGDPTLLSRMEQAARRDPDPAVQRLADQIASRRKAALR